MATIIKQNNKEQQYLDFLLDLKKSIETNQSIKQSDLAKKHKVNILSFTILANSGLIRNIGTKINSLGYVKNVGNHIKTNYKWNTGDVNIQMVFALKEAVKNANLKLKNAPKVNTVEPNIIQKKSEVKSETETPVIEKLFAFTKQNSIQNYTMTIPLFWGLIKLNVNIKNK